MAAGPRELGFSYAGLLVGGPSTSHLLWGGAYDYRENYGEVFFSARVLARGDTESAFALACNQLETAFATPNGKLIVSLNVQIINEFGHVENTGFLARPSCNRVGGPEDSARSRLYAVSVAAQHPADLSGKGGLRVAQLSFQKEVWGGRSYSVTGTYTATPTGGSASANYAANLDGLLDNFESELGGTWLRTTERAEHDDEDKVLQFTASGLEAGLRDGKLEVFTTVNGIRSYRFSGMYPATDAQDAESEYEAAIDGILSSIESDLGGTWLRTNEVVNTDQTKKTCSFVREALECGLRDAQLFVNTTITGLRSYRLTGVYPADPPTAASAIYATNIDGLLSAIETSLGGEWLRTGDTLQTDQTDKFAHFSQDAIETGLRDQFLEVMETVNGLRSYRLSGSYPATSTQTSEEVYVASIGGLTTSIEASLGGDWITVAKAYRNDQTKTITTFTHDAIETGLRNASYRVNKLATDRRNYVVRGQYEATTTQTAKEVYEASIDAILSAFESSLGGEWERTLNSYDDDQTSKIITFEYNGSEVIFPETASVLNDPNLKNVQIAIVSNAEYPGDSTIDTQRPVTITVSFAADVVKDSIPDLANYWKTRVMPYLFQLASDTITASAYALMSDNPSFSRSTSRLEGIIRVQAFTSSRFLRRQITVEDNEDLGVVLVPVWNGDPLACAEFQGPAQKTKTVSDDVLELSGPPAEGGGGGGGIGGGGTEMRDTSAPIVISPDYVEVSRSDRVIPTKIGAAGRQVSAQVRVSVRSYRFRNKITR